LEPGTNTFVRTPLLNGCYNPPSNDQNISQA
jgi:hypothetical protein